MSDDPNFQAALEQVRLLTAELGAEKQLRLDAEQRASGLWDEVVDLRSRFQNVCAQLRALEESV